MKFHSPFPSILCIHLRCDCFVVVCESCCSLFMESAQSWSNLIRCIRGFIIVYSSTEALYLLSNEYTNTQKCICQLELKGTCIYFVAGALVFYTISGNDIETKWETEEHTTQEKGCLSAAKIKKHKNKHKGHTLQSVRCVPCWCLFF